MPSFKTFYVAPSLPPKLDFLRELAYNLWWTWNTDAISLFMRLDPDLWEETNHNPVMLLSRVSQEKLRQAEADEGFTSSMDSVRQAFRKYLDNSTPWFKSLPLTPSNILVAYFSAEYGLTECLPLYSGGLGILAGDHLKSSSEIGLPLIGVGILYEKGYFRQYLNPDGWQQEYYPVADYSFLPIRLMENRDGSPLVFPVQFPDREVFVQVWKADVGRNRLLLLDTNIERNAQRDQDIADYLYGGDIEMRLCQELILGIGGIKALGAAGYDPTVFHMNEGHAAFMSLERIRALIEKNGLSFKEAREIVASSNVFTTHTPVPAGSDHFPPRLVAKYFQSYVEKLGISMDEFLALGRKNPGDDKEHFCMTVLALRLSYLHNGVAELHGRTSRKLWQDVWPQVMADEVPISHVTNGVCHKAWVSVEFQDLYDRYLGPRWSESPEDPEIWKRADLIPGEELWRRHERRRERLVAFARKKLQQQMKRHNASREELEAISDVLHPEALTIGFARRFAAYKRASLLFQDKARLAKILGDTERPVQIIFAGKAHPKDENGKEIIRSIIHMCREEPFNRRIVFIEDHDMNVARYLVQGCDVWLNNPRRPLEASGTSGMKAALNCVLNCSVLDGWWAEAYRPDIGWSIGQGEEYDEAEYCDSVESRYLYTILEKEIVPLFYDRGRDLRPRGWVEKMKSSIRMLGPVFTTNRMVREYTERFYMAADIRHNNLAKDNFEGARTLAAWKERIAGRWEGVRIVDVETTLGRQELVVGDHADFTVKVRLGDELGESDIRVEIVYGPMGSTGKLSRINKVEARFEKKTDDGTSLFSGRIRCRESGRRGYAVRILPKHEYLKHPSELDLIKWG
ncbi:MAG: alpha-glucan family phosphorylase [Pseudomonadota bacterium]